MSNNTVKELEKELYELKNGKNHGFVLDPNSEQKNSKKLKIRKENNIILSKFLLWLEHNNIKLKRCGIKEKSVLLRIHGKESLNFKKTQEECNILKEIIFRCSNDFLNK